MLVLCRCFSPRRPEYITSQKIPPTTMMATKTKIAVLLMMVSPHLPDKSGTHNFEWTRIRTRRPCRIIKLIQRAWFRQEEEDPVRVAAISAVWKALETANFVSQWIARDRAKPIAVWMFRRQHESGCLCRRASACGPLSAHGSCQCHFVMTSERRSLSATDDFRRRTQLQPVTVENTFLRCLRHTAKTARRR